MIIRRGGRFYIVDPTTGRRYLYKPISGSYGTEWVAIAAVVATVAATAVTTYASYQQQAAQQSMYKAQQAADSERAAREIEASQLEAKSIQERAAWEAQAATDAAEFEATSAKELAALQGRNAQEVADFEAKSAKEVADLEAENLRTQGAEQDYQSRRRNAIILGKKRAIAAANGVALTSGSPLMSELDFVKNAEIEALNISQAAETAALSTTRAAQLRGEGAQLRAGVEVSELNARAQDVGLGARYEAALRSQAAVMAGQAQSWSTIFQGRVKESESLFASRMAGFRVDALGREQSFTILRGVTSAAASGVSAYSAATYRYGTTTPRVTEFRD